MADWREKNRDKNRRDDRRRYRENPGYYSRRAQEWREANPEKVQAANQRKQAKRDHAKAQKLKG